MYPSRVSDAAPQDGRPDAGASADRSIGRYLASQRRLRGISLDELAARTKIPRRNLERLESGAFDGPPDGFVRGFVRTVAESLGLDPQETVMRLVGEPPGGEEELRRRRMWSAAGLVAIALGLLLALGLVLRLAMLWIVEPSGGQPELVRRPDAVRSLVEQLEASRAAEERSGESGAAGED